MKKEASSLEKLVKSVMARLDKGGRLTEEDILDAWEAVVGKRASGHSRPRSFRASTLLVNVDGSGWLYELTVQKREILKKLEGRLKGRRVKDIRFRIGEIR